MSIIHVEIDINAPAAIEDVPHSSPPGYGFEIMIVHEPVERPSYHLVAEVTRPIERHPTPAGVSS